MRKLLLLVLVMCSGTLYAQTSQKDIKIYLDSFYKNISADKLLGYVKELSNPKYEGRLAGSKGMEKAVNWAIGRFEEWDLSPKGDNGGYIQYFSHPSTEIHEGSGLEILIPIKSDNKKVNDYVSKTYPWSDGWYAGGTSGNGTITAEVVYAGFGVSAPEMGYDDYAGIDVKGKIVLIEGETPNRSNNPDTLRMWYKHTLHQTKHQTAMENGAIGMLYKWVCGPNHGYDKDFIYCYVTDMVTDDIFLGTGKTYKETVQKIYKTQKPQSFNTGKKATIKMVATHNPDATGKNVIGMIEGSDPKLKDEFVVISGHLDHLGMIPYHIAGANDNNSSTSVLMGVAESLAKSKIKPRRSVLFINIDGEEAGLTGSTYFVNNPVVPKDKVVAVLNLEQVGVGVNLGVSYGVEYPKLGEYFQKVNDSYVHRTTRIYPNSHIPRPRTDGAVFMKADYPCVDLRASGEFRGYYHNPKDDWQSITPEILRDMTKLLLLTTVELANAEDAGLK